MSNSSNIQHHQFNIQCLTWWFNVQHSILITKSTSGLCPIYTTLVLIINLIPKWCHIDSDHYFDTQIIGLMSNIYDPIINLMSNLLLDYQDYLLYLISCLSIDSCNATWKHDLVIAGPQHWLPTFNFLTWRILICSSVYISITLILRLGLIWFPVTSVPQYRLNVQLNSLMSDIDPDCWFNELVGLMSMAVLLVYVHTWFWS